MAKDISLFLLLFHVSLVIRDRYLLLILNHELRDHYKAKIEGLVLKKMATFGPRIFEIADKRPRIARAAYIINISILLKN